jgi:putative dehydrogenase
MAVAPVSPDPVFAVGIVGVGNMGGAMAANLLARGWPVRVNDLDAEKTRNLESFGAVPIASGSQLAIESEAVIVCVVDAAQTEQVLFGPQGVARGLQPGRAVLLCPTIAPADVEDFAARLAKVGLHAIDAPMSGGPARARDGSMSLMVACADAVFEAHRGLIAALSSRVFRISQRPGDGARTKLVNNLLAGINLVGAAEALALAESLGLDPMGTLAVIEQSSGQSWIGTDRMRRALAGDLAPRAHMTLLAKDTALAIAVAQRAGIAGPLGDKAAAVFARALDAGLAEQDDAALLHLLRQRPKARHNRASQPCLGDHKECFMAGKFELKKSKNDKFFFTLHASNGQTLLTSEMYESKASAVNGIASVQKNAADDARYGRLAGKDGSPYFVLKAGNGQVIGQSQMYSGEKARDDGIASCQANGPGAATDDQTA